MRAITGPAVSRRRLLGAAATAWLAAPHAAWAHSELGPVEPPLTLPDVMLTLHDGRSTSLARVLQGRVTALQLIFTGCSATCPLQGAVFAGVQARLAGTLSRAQLLSISIDPLNDDARAVDTWRRRFGAGPRWLAAVPPVQQAELLLDALAGRARGDDRHTAQTYLCDPQGRWAYRFADLASAADVVRGMQALDRRA